MFKYYIRSENNVHEIGSGSIIDFGTASTQVENRTNPLNNRTLSWYRGTLWSTGAFQGDIGSSGSLEIEDPSLIPQSTKIEIDGNALVEGVDWDLKSTALETANSIFSALNSNSNIISKLDLFQDETTLYFKTKQTGPSTDLSYNVNWNTGLKVNGEDLVSGAYLAGGANNAKIFGVYRYDLQTGSWFTAFDEKTNDTKPTVANYPKTTALYNTAGELYYLYLKPNFDETSTFVGYRSFELVSGTGFLKVNNKFETKFNLDPANYDSFSDVIDYKGQIFLSVVSENDNPTQIFRINLSNGSIKNVPITASGSSDAFFIQGSDLFNVSSENAKIFRYNSTLDIFESSFNFNTAPLDKRFKIGVDYSDGFYYLAGTDSTWQGRLYRTSNLNNNSPWIPLTSIGSPTTYQNFSVIDDSNVGQDRIIVARQIASGSFFVDEYTTVSGYKNLASGINIFGSSGIVPFNQSNPDLVIDSTTFNFTGNLTVLYTIYDLESDLTNVKFEYSTDAGINWSPGSIVSGSSTSGTLSSGGEILNVSTTPNNKLFLNNGGSQHQFIWDSKKDLGVGTFNNTRIRLSAFN